MKLRFFPPYKPISLMCLFCWIVIVLLSVSSVRNSIMVWLIERLFITKSKTVLICLFVFVFWFRFVRVLRFWLFVGIGFVVWRSCVQVGYCIWRRCHASFLFGVIRLHRLGWCGRLVCWAADCRRYRLVVLWGLFFGWQCIRDDCDVCS